MSENCTINTSWSWDIRKMHIPCTDKRQVSWLKDHHSRSVFPTGKVSDCLISRHCPFIPLSQWRDRAGLAPASLLPSDRTSADARRGTVYHIWFFTIDLYAYAILLIIPQPISFSSHFTQNHSLAHMDFCDYRKFSKFRQIIFVHLFRRWQVFGKILYYLL